MNEIFQDIRGLVRDVGVIVTPEVDTALYSQVALQARAGALWLVAKGAPQGMFSPQFGWWDAAKHEVYRKAPDQFRLLFSVIELVQEPVGWERLETCLPQESALAWCQHYGFPEVEQRDVDDGAEWLRLKTFQQQCVTLYLLVQLWVALRYDGQEKLDATLAPLVQAPRTLQQMPPTMRQRYAHRFLSRAITARIGRITLAMPWPGMDRPRLTLNASSLFDYTYFQLASLILKPEDEVRRNLKACHNRACNQVFWGHGNRKYCSQCDRRTVWSRKMRRAQKEQGNTQRWRHS